MFAQGNSFLKDGQFFQTFYERINFSIRVGCEYNRTNIQKAIVVLPLRIYFLSV